MNHTSKIKNMKKIKEVVRETSDAIVYLAPSKIHKTGVGVFTDIDIKVGEFVRIWDGKDCKFISKRAGRHTRNFLKERFCVETSRGWWCPLDWIRMSVGWYLNHSSEPNLRSDDGDNYYTIRKVKSGEELTINYSELDEDDNNSLDKGLLKAGFYERT